MYEINNNVTNNIIINKSNFICCLFKVYDENSIKQILENVKLEYKDATHYCYAYIIGEKRKSSDDGEPGGTAGIPMLDVLIKNKITNILCVVVRYFGGIKLGAGGLVRAYSKSVKSALECVDLLVLIPSYILEIKFGYDKIKLIDNILKDSLVIEKKFDEIITYKINIEQSCDFINKLNNLCLSCNKLNSSFITKKPE